MVTSILQGATFFVAAVYWGDAVIDMMRDERMRQRLRPPRPKRVPAFVETEPGVIYRDPNGRKVIYYDASGAYHWD